MKLTGLQLCVCAIRYSRYISEMTEKEKNKKLFQQIVVTAILIIIKLYYNRTM